MTASSGNLEYETCDSYSNSEQALLQLHTPQMILSETEKKKKKVRFFSVSLVLVKLRHLS